MPRFHPTVCFRPSNCWTFPTCRVLPFLFFPPFLPLPIPFVIVYRPHDALCQKGSKGRRRSAPMPIFPRRWKQKLNANRGNLLAIPLQMQIRICVCSSVCLPRRQIGVAQRRKIFFPSRKSRFTPPSTFANRNTYICIYSSRMTNRNCDSESVVVVLLKEKRIYAFPLTRGHVCRVCVTKRINEAKFSTRENRKIDFP